MIDLHTHSLYSDGTETPRALVKRAVTARLTAFAVADHDTVAGQEEAIEAGSQLGTKVLSSVELTADFHGGHIHILGYGFDIHHEKLRAALERRAGERTAQFYEKVAMANRRLKEKGRGVLDADELLQGITGSPGRPHIARAIVERGWAPSFRPAFDAYLIDYTPETPAFDAEEAISLIHVAGGIAALAHPGSDEIGLRRFASNEHDEWAAFEELMKMGIDGVEAYTPAHTPALVQHYLKFAEQANLVITGGTDWHGPTFDAPAPGEFEIPDNLLDALKEKLLKHV